MTSSINSYLPYSYLNTLNPALTSAAAPSTAANTSAAASTSANTSGVNGTDSGSPQLSSDVIALLQQLQPGSSSNSNTSIAALLGNSTGSTDPITSLLGGNSSSASSDISALLGDSSGASDTNALLGDFSSNSGIDALISQSSNTLLSGVYAQALQAAYSGAAQQANATTTATDPVEAVLAQYQAASNAYNTTLLQNAQSVLDANSYSADGSTLA